MALRLDDFKIARRWNGFNRFLQIVFSISLIWGLNYLASQPRYQARWNLGSAKKESLSQETLQYLDAIGRRAPETISKDNPWVQVFVTLSVDPADPHPELTGTFLKQINYLTKDVAYAAAQSSRGEWLKVESADHIKNRGVWTELVRKFGDPGKEDAALAVVCGDRCKYISITELLGTRTTAKGDIEINAFRGELVLMSAILSVTDKNVPIVYLTTGHGEMSLNEANALRGLSKLELQLSSRNLEVKQLNLNEFNEVPTNAALVIIVSPTTPFRPQEVEKLRRYMREKKGRLIALVDVGSQHGLDDLFYEWGIRVANAFVCETSEDLLTPNKDILLRATKSSHDLVKLMQGTNETNPGVGLVVGQACPVGFDLGSPIDENLKVEELVASSAASWGEMDYRHHTYKFDPDRGDMPGPVSVVAVAERAAGLKQGIKIPGERMLVIGSSDIVANARFGEGVNRFFLTNAVMWMLDRESLLNIPPRPLAEFRLNANPPDLNSVAWRFLLVPGSVLLLGFFVFFWRRNT
ncbi:MAG: GldG family protein [Puniceicoccales bacterium]|jgi:hypothetical protein|nr:GldG family protein [Puniceicoccales bacterium]